MSKERTLAERRECGSSLFFGGLFIFPTLEWATHHSLKPEHFLGGTEPNGLGIVFGLLLCCSVSGAILMAVEQWSKKGPGDFGLLAFIAIMVWAGLGGQVLTAWTIFGPLETVEGLLVLGIFDGVIALTGFMMLRDLHQECPDFPLFG